MQDRSKRSNTSRSKSYTYGSESMRNLKARLWSWKGRSTEDGEDSVQLQEIGGIHVSEGTRVLRPENAYHPV